MQAKFVTTKFPTTPYKLDSSGHLTKVVDPEGQWVLEDTNVVACEGLPGVLRALVFYTSYPFKLVDYIEGPVCDGTFTPIDYLHKVAAYQDFQSLPKTFEALTEFVFTPRRSKVFPGKEATGMFFYRPKTKEIAYLSKTMLSS